jgi:protein-disulfide isomerase
MFLAFGIGIAAAVALVAVGALFRGQGDAPPPVQTPVVELSGIPQDNTLLGKPTARVTLIEYVDAQCPGCRYYTLSMFPTIVKNYVRPGKVKIEYRGFPFIGSDSVKALQFILAAGRQDRLFQLQEALYRHQGNENSGWVTDDLIRQLARTIGGLDVQKLFADAASDEVTRTANQAEPEASAAGIPGTPTFFVRIGNQQPYYLRIALDVAELRAGLDDALKG